MQAKSAILIIRKPTQKKVLKERNKETIEACRQHNVGTVV